MYLKLYRACSMFYISDLYDDIGAADFCVLCSTLNCLWSLHVWRFACYGYRRSSDAGTDHLCITRSRAVCNFIISPVCCIALSASTTSRVYDQHQGPAVTSRWLLWRQRAVCLQGAEATSVAAAPRPSFYCIAVFFLYSSSYSPAHHHATHFYYC